MNTADFTTTLVVEQSPQEAYNAINNVRGWWSEEIEGCTDTLNEVFKYHFEDVHLCTIKVAELVPNQKVVWDVLENYFKFTQDKTEWTGNKIIFEIAEKDGKTEITFTQQGLTPEYECYEICNGAWTNYIQKSLKNLVNTGTGNPNAAGKPQTEKEQELSSSAK